MIIKHEKIRQQPEWFIYLTQADALWLAEQLIRCARSEHNDSFTTYEETGSHHERININVIQDIELWSKMR